MLHNEIGVKNQFMTIGEAASYLGVSRSTLRNWDKQGKLNAKRHPISRYRVYDREELDKVFCDFRESDEATQHQ